MGRSLTQGSPMTPQDDVSAPAKLDERQRTWIELPRSLMERLHVMRIITGRSTSELIQHCLESHMPELGELADQPLGRPQGSGPGST